MSTHLVRIASTLALLVATCAFARAQGLFEETSKTFGSVPRGTELTHSFRLTNTLGSRIHIASLRSSCGCAVPSIGKSELEAGESTFVTVNVDTRKYSGLKTFTIFVQMDEPYQSEARLQVTARSREDLAINPNQIAFGRVKKGASPVSGVTIEHFGYDHWQITGVENDNGFLIPEITEVGREPGHVSYQLNVRLREDTPVGAWHATMCILTNDSSTPKIQIPLTVEVEGLLTATPAEASFGRVRPGDLVERKIVIRGAKPFKIRKLEGSDEHCQVTSSSADSRVVHVLTARLVAKSPESFSRRIKVYTDLGDDDSVEFSVRAVVVP